MKSLRHRAFYRLVGAREQNLVTLGSVCAWTICPRGLGESSVVYSAGVGGDVSFELELAARFGCEILLLDPSAVGAETMKKAENRHPKIHFRQLALVGREGALEDRVSIAEDGYVSLGDGCGKKAGAVPAASLRSLMQASGHTRIDLLKMDIEGFEYEVLDHILRERIPVGQICVELHQRPHFDIPKRKKIEAILRLGLHGYRLVHQVDYDHTFLKR